MFSFSQSIKAPTGMSPVNVLAAAIEKQTGETVKAASLANMIIMSGGGVAPETICVTDVIVTTDGQKTPINIDFKNFPNICIKNRKLKDFRQTLDHYNERVPATKADPSNEWTMKKMFFDFSTKSKNP